MGEFESNPLAKSLWSAHVARSTGYSDGTAAGEAGREERRREREAQEKLRRQMKAQAAAAKRPQTRGGSSKGGLTVLGIIVLCFAIYFVLKNVSVSASSGSIVPVLIWGAAITVLIRYWRVILGLAFWGGILYLFFGR